MLTLLARVDPDLSSRGCEKKVADEICSLDPSSPSSSLGDSGCRPRLGRLSCVGETSDDERWWADRSLIGTVAARRTAEQSQ